jgi:hypothetical protein
MHQQSIVLYLTRKGFTTQVIHADLVAILSEEAIAYSTVTKHLGEAQINPSDPNQLSDATSPHIEDSEEATLIALEEFPFSSVRQLSCATYLPGTTVTGDSLRNSGLPRVIFDECHKSCVTIRRQHGSSFQSPF